MSYDFNASDIMEMAVQMERNGAGFYRASAQKMTDADAKKLLLELAAMEDDHEKTFTAIKKELSEKEKQSTVFDPDGEAGQYLRALVDIRVFYKKDMPVDSIREILKSAIEAEKDSIVFYLGLRDMVPEKMGRNRIDQVIKEEMGHVRTLSKKLVALPK
ncbi:MAG: ferritin-like domain-containing protein [Thermodesulfobacteriota bacterium]